MPSCIWLCFLGADQALRSRSHLGVDFFVRVFSTRLRFWIEAALTVVIIIFLLSLAVTGTQLTILNKERLFGDSGIPYAFVTIAVPFGCVLLSCTLVANLIEAWRYNRSNGTLIMTKNATIERGEME